MLCCCRYMIVDLKRFTPGSDLPAGLLWVAEQIPGLVASGDVTEQLARGYWPSYNIPYFPEVRTCSQHLPALHPPHSFYTHQASQRACMSGIVHANPSEALRPQHWRLLLNTIQLSCQASSRLQAHVTECCRHGLTCAAER